MGTSGREKSTNPSTLTLILLVLFSLSKFTTAQTTCEAANPDVTIPDDKSWNSYTFSCRQAGGQCYSSSSENDCLTNWDWRPTGYCGVSNLGVSCGCCMPPVTEAPTPAPPPSRIDPSTTVTYYINANTGDNNNDGLSESSPFKTIQKATQGIQSGRDPCGRWDLPQLQL